MVVQCVGQNLGVTGFPGQFDRLRGEQPGLTVSAGQHRQLRGVAVRPGQLGEVARVLQDRKCLLRSLICRPVASGVPPQPRQPPEGHAQPDRVGEPGSQGHRTFLGLRSCRRGADREALDGIALQQFGPLVVSKGVLGPQQAPVVVGRFPVCTGRAGIPGRPGTEPDQCIAVTHRVTVMEDQGQVRARAGKLCIKRSLMQMPYLRRRK